MGKGCARGGIVREMARTPIALREIPKTLNLFDGLAEISRRGRDIRRFLVVKRGRDFIYPNLSLSRIYTATPTNPIWATLF